MQRFSKKMPQYRSLKTSKRSRDAGTSVDQLKTVSSLLVDQSVKGGSRASN